MSKFYDLSDSSEEAQRFWAIMAGYELYAATHGIRAALDKYTSENPFYAEAIEEAVEAGEEFEFLTADADDENPDADELSDTARQAIVEALGRARGFYVSDAGDRYEWDGNCWTDACGNGFSTSYIAVGFWEE